MLSATSLEMLIGKFGGFSKSSKSSTNHETDYSDFFERNLSEQTAQIHQSVLSEDLKALDHQNNNLLPSKENQCHLVSHATRTKMIRHSRNTKRRFIKSGDSIVIYKLQRPSFGSENNNDQKPKKEIINDSKVQ